MSGTSRRAALRVSPLDRKLAGEAGRRPAPQRLALELGIVEPIIDLYGAEPIPAIDAAFHDTAMAPLSAEPTASRRRSRAPLKGSRLWLRVDPEQHRRMRLAAAFVGQSATAFMIDALANFIADGAVLPMDPAPPVATGRAGEDHIKLSLRLGAKRRRDILFAAAGRGCSVQEFLLTALEQHVERTACAPANRGLLFLLHARGATRIAQFFAPAFQKAAAHALELPGAAMEDAPSDSDIEGFAEGERGDQRIALKFDAARRWKIRVGAAYLGQTEQEFVAGAVDAFLGRALRRRRG
jgi:uncharacterized protein (DUF1778 family)